MFGFVYFNEAFDSWCRGVHVYVSPFRILWDQCLAAIYTLSDFGLEALGRIFFCGLEVVRLYEVLDFCVVLFSW